MIKLNEKNIYIMYKMFKVTAETFAKSCVHTRKVK